MIAETVLWLTVTPRAKRSSAVTLRLTIGATGGLVDLADRVRQPHAAKPRRRGWPTLPGRSRRHERRPRSGTPDARPVPARSEPQSPGRAFWTDACAKEDFVYLPCDGELGLELMDALLGGREFDLLVGVKAVDLSVINLVLPDPVVDRRLAHAKSLLELPCAECLTALTRSPDDEPPWGTCRAFDPPSRRRIPETRVNCFGGRSGCPSCDIHIVRMELLVRLATRLSSP